MRQFRLVTVFTLACACYASSASAQVIVFYGFADGNLTVVSLRRGITTFEAKAVDDLFIPNKVVPKVLAPPFDLITPKKLFTLKQHGFRYVDFGNVLPPRRAVWRRLGFTGALTHLPNVKGSLKSDGGALVILPAGPSGIRQFLLGLLTFP